MGALLASEAAPAKINLALHVTGQRPDGFHDLESLVAFAEIGDDLDAFPADEDSLVLAGPFASALSPGQSNLVLKAVSAFRRAWPDAVPHGLELRLAKNLPVASGIGGGSADAAAALRLMNALSAAPASDGELAELAVSLGADVPVCLFSRPCLVHGIGEVVQPLAEFPQAHIVLVNPLVAVATAEIFRHLHQRQNPPLPPLPDQLSHAAMLGLWMKETRNDLQSAAIAVVPQIGALIEELQGLQGCVAARMSGSGATVFGLFGSGALAHQAAQDLRKNFPDYWVAAAPLVQPENI